MVPSVIGHVFHLLLLQRKATGVLGDGLRCLALTRMSCRLLQRRKDRLVSERRGIGSERLAELRNQNVKFTFKFIYVQRKLSYKKLARVL